MVLTKEQAERVTKVLLDFDFPFSVIREVCDGVRTELIDKYWHNGLMEPEGLSAVKFFDGALMAILCVRASYAYTDQIEDETIELFFKDAVENWAMVMTHCCESTVYNIYEPCQFDKSASDIGILMGVKKNGPNKRTS